MAHAPPPPQGTPLKYDGSAPSASSKKHDVRSIIGSPGRTFPPLHPLDVMADARALERACYEESLKSRPGAASGSGGSITRGAPVIVPELGKPRQSPLTYEDHGAPFSSHLPRGSPVTTREPTPRLQEGAWGVGVGRGSGGRVRVRPCLAGQSSSVRDWGVPVPCRTPSARPMGSASESCSGPSPQPRPDQHLSHLALHPNSPPSCRAMTCLSNGCQILFRNIYIE